MQTLETEHTEMHQAIKRVMDAKEQGDNETVAKELEVVDTQSALVVSTLYEMIDQL